jgi:hypothetical protein
VDKFCFTCGNGSIVVDGGCPGCGRVPKSLDLSKDDPETAITFLNKVKETRIPDEYVDVEWSVERFLVYKGLSSADKDKDLFLSRYLDSLQRLHDIFASGVLSPKSAFIIAPSTYSKVTFAYSCMKHALKNGLSVAPLIDTQDLKRMFVLSAEKMDYKLHTYINYDEYITSDVLFVTVTKTPYRYEAFSVIEELLGKRSRLGLSTFILSRYNLSVLSRWDKDNQFKKLASASARDNFKKFPAQIIYKEPYSV